MKKTDISEELKCLIMEEVLYYNNGWEEDGYNHPQTIGNTPDGHPILPLKVLVSNVADDALNLEQEAIISDCPYTIKQELQEIAYNFGALTPLNDFYTKEQWDHFLANRPNSEEESHEAEIKDVIEYFESLSLSNNFNKEEVVAFVLDSLSTYLKGN